MGTNYYLITNVCAHCKRGDERRHIGKAACGWHFALRVYPEDGINTLEDWKRHLERADSAIVDEYGREFGIVDMLQTITQRYREKPSALTTEFYESNHAEPGLNGLLRAKVDGDHCVGHGEGTWDYMGREFS